MNYEAEKRRAFLTSTFNLFLSASPKQKNQKQDWKGYSKQPKQNITGCARCFYFIR